MAERKSSQSAGKSQPKKKDNGKDDTDLTTILNDNQRADLTLLVANVTESMRKLILDNFDSTAGLNKSLLRDGMSEDEKLMAADPNTDVGDYDKERKLKAEIDKDLATLKMKNLKKNSLKAFDDWREQVILRVGEVVNSQRTAKAQMQKEAKADIARPQARNTAGKVVQGGNKVANLKFKDLFPATKTPLTKMPMNQRTLILHSILLLLISLEHYNAFSRVLLLNLTSSLKLPLKTFEQDEYATAKGLLEAAKEMSADEEIKKKVKENEETRKTRVRYAAIAGAAILGVSGGMAAPLVAAGVGSIMGGLGLGATSAAAYLGSVAGSTVLVGSLFGAYGGKMTGQMMDTYAREVEDFQFLPVHGSSDKKTSEDQDEGAKQASGHDHKLRVTIGISGWLTEKEEVVKPWRSLGTGAEVFALKYELEALLNLGNAMNGMVSSAAWGYAQKEIVSRTIFADLAAAMWPMALMKVARVIDNPFSVAKSRADKAGEVLADALINRAQGERPVTLMGYSLGARVIYTCLMSLAKRKEFGLVENAVLIGSPTPSDTSDWRVLRSAVAGRLVNVYSNNDYVLGFMYRTSAIQYGVAGLQKVEGLASVENFDVTEDVDSHQRYRYLIGGILKKIGFEDIDMAAVEREQEALKQMEEEEKKQAKESQKKWLLRRESNSGKVDEAAEGEAEANELEKKVQDQTKKSLVTRAVEYFYTPSVPNAKDAEKAAGNLQKAVKDPKSAGDAANDTAKDVQASTQSYATYIYKNLPSMPHMSRAAATKDGPQKAASTKTNQATKAAEGASDQAQTYVQQASQYLPSLPGGGGKSKSKVQKPKKESQTTTAKATESTTKAAGQATEQAQSYAQQASQYLPSLQSMPSLPGRGGKTKPAKPQKQELTTATQKAGDTAAKAANTTTTAAKGTAGVAADTVDTTVRNALNPKDNPAVKSTKSSLDKAPIIHQAKDRTPAPVKNTASQVSDAAGTTVQNTTQTVQKGLDTTTGTAGKAGKTAADNAQKAGQAATNQGKNAGKAVTDQAQNTAKQGGSYTSKAASYLPSVPSFRAKPPKLTRAPSSGVKSPPAKLDRKDSGMKSGREPASTGAQQVTSTTKAVGESTANGAKQAGGTVGAGVKQGGDVAGKGAQQVSSTAKTVGEGATSGAKQAGGIVGGLGRKVGFGG